LQDDGREIPNDNRSVPPVEASAPVEPELTSLFIRCGAQVSLPHHQKGLR
jgi:hypothetical protein